MKELTKRVAHTIAATSAFACLAGTAYSDTRTPNPAPVIVTNTPLSVTASSPIPITVAVPLPVNVTPNYTPVTKFFVVMLDGYATPSAGQHHTWSLFEGDEFVLVGMSMELDATKLVDGTAHTRCDGSFGQGTTGHALDFARADSGQKTNATYTPLPNLYVAGPDQIHLNFFVNQAPLGSGASGSCYGVLKLYAVKPN